MLDTAQHASAAPRSRERAEWLALAARLDWVLLAGGALVLSFGLCAVAGITQHDVAGDENYFVVRQALAAVIGAGRARGRRDRADRPRRAGTGGVVYGGDARADGPRLPRSPRPFAAPSAGSTSASSSSSRPSSARCCSFSRSPASSWSARGRVNSLADGAVRDRARSRSRSCSSSSSRTSGRRSSTRLRSSRFSSSSGVRWRQLAGCWLVAACRDSSRSSGSCRRPASQVLKPYQTERDSGSSIRTRDPSGLTYNAEPVDHGRRLRRPRRVAASIEASQTRLDYLPEHATDFAFASLAEQRGFVGSAILLLLYLLVVWRGLAGRSRSRATSTAPSSRAGSSSRSSSRSSSTSGMTMGVAPVTGIPLPFVTVGGKRWWLTSLMIGILQSIHARGVLGGRPLP